MLSQGEQEREDEARWCTMRQTGKKAGLQSKMERISMRGEKINKGQGGGRKGGSERNRRKALCSETMLSGAALSEQEVREPLVAMS